MKRLILTAAILALVGADSQACGRRQPVRNFVRAVFGQPQQTGEGLSGGGCQSAPPAGPVRTAVGNSFEHVGSILVGAGNAIHSTTFRPSWDSPVPACANGYCPIPSPGLPTR